MLGALEGRRGCLLTNHGTITYGDTLGAAYRRAEQLEWVCRLWLRSRSAVTPDLLSQQEMEHIVERLRGYGKNEVHSGLVVEL